MAQQVNLCLIILRKQKRGFSAQMMLQLLAIFLLVSAVLAAAWVWNLNHASASLKSTLALQSTELEGLRAALERGKASNAPAELAQAQALKVNKAALAQRETVLAALRQGLFQPGLGHSARLQLVAQSIPAQAWVTQIRADAHVLEVSGYVLETEVLNDWVARLASSPLLTGQTLSAVKLENVKPESVLLGPAGLPSLGGKAALASSAVSVPGRVLPLLWSFNLLSSMAAPAVLPVPAGVKP